MSEQALAPDGMQHNSQDNRSEHSSSVEPKVASDNSDVNYQVLVKKYANWLSVMQKVTQIVNTDDNKIESVFSEALQTILNTLGYCAAQIYRLSPYGEDLWLYLEEGTGSKLVSKFQDIFPVTEKNIITDSAGGAKVIYIPQISKGPYSYYPQDRTKPLIESELAIPLKFDGPADKTNVLGVLLVQSTKIDNFDQVDSGFFVTIAQQFTALIKGSQTIHQLQNDLNEIKILYNLQGKNNLDNLPVSGGSGVSLLGYRHDGQKFTQTNDLPSIAKLMLAKGESNSTITRSGDKEEIVAPIKLHGETIGVLGIENLESDKDWSQEDIDFIEEISTQVALAVENSRLLQQTHAALAETQKLYQISRALVETEDLNDIFKVVIDNVKAFDIDRVSISLIDPDLSGQLSITSSNTVTIVAGWDRESDEILPVGSQISAEMFSLVQAFAKPPFGPLISEDLSRPKQQDKRMDEAFRLFMYERLGAITLFSTPMFLGTEYKGVLSISTRHAHTYTIQEQRVYQTLADQSIIAIENRRLFEAVRHERDQTALLHKIDGALGQATTVDQVQEIILKFTKDINAAHGEVYVTDDRDFFSAASTLEERQDVSEETIKFFTKEVFDYDFAKEGLRRPKSLIKHTSQINNADIEKELKAVSISSVISTFFYSQRSNLRGVLTFFRTHEAEFIASETSLLEAIATQMLATLENVWLLRQTTIALSETEVLYEVTRDFNRARHPEEMLDILARSFVTTDLQGNVNIDYIVIAKTFELSTNALLKRLNILAQWSYQTPTASPLEIIRETEMTPDRYSFITQIRPDEPQIVAYESLDGPTQQNIDDHFGRSRSILAMPLTVGSNWLGVLFVASRDADFVFKHSLVHRISTLAGQAAVVIQNLQLVEETQQTLYNSEILSQLGQELLATETTEKVYELSLDAIALTEPGRGAAIFMYAEDEESVELEIVSAWNNPTGKGGTFSPGDRFSEESLGLTTMLHKGGTIVADRVQTDLRFSDELQSILAAIHIESFIAVPIWLKKNVRGFILVGHYRPYTFTPDAIRLYEDVARQVSGALENLRLLEETQYRAALLQTAAEVSQAATSYLDLDSLLSQSVDLIKERFNFYHVSIFLVDEYQRYAIVRASTGKVGQKMVAKPHKLEVGGRSIVGTATTTGKFRMASDVGQDSGHFNNPLLPDTRAEMALPLISRGKVIGALDVQSTKPHAFTEIDITILQSMANQLANAIEAALSFQDSQEALDRVRKLNEYYLREQWGIFLKNRRSRQGYILTKDGLDEMEADDWQTEMQQTSRMKKPLIISKKMETDEPLSAQSLRMTKTRSDSQLYLSLPDIQETNEPATLIAPLTLQNEIIIGSLGLELSNQNTTWRDDNLEIIEAVTQQAAQAVEAARLFEQTQAAREEAEALYRVGRTLVSVESEQAMFETVLREMLTTLGLEQGGVLLFDPNSDKKLGRLEALFKKGRPVEAGEFIPIENNPSYERIIVTKKPLAIEDALNDPILATVREINIARNVASLLLVPIIKEDQVIGAIGADSVGQKHVFTEREINLARAMADQLSIMLQNRRLIEQASRRAVQLQTSADVGRAATEILNEDLMLEKVVDLIKVRFGFYHTQIFLIDSTKKFAFLHKSTGSAGQKLLAAKYKVAIGNQSVVGQATYQRRPLVIRDANPIDLGAPHPQHEFLPNSQAELAIPLLYRNELIGVLDVHSDQPNAFSKEDIATLEVLAAQLVIAIENARAFREQRETAERLKEIDKLKTQFLANMSHELRTPLNSIIGFSRVILKGIDGPLTELQKTDLTSIHNSGQHLLSLINNILDLSKIEAGKMELNFEEVEIEPIIKGVMATAIALVKDRPVELIQEIPDDLPTVGADPTRIRQIVLNLVSNACKFTEEGSVTLRVEADAKNLTISVKDTGIGIPEDQLGSIFEEFTQVDASTTRKVGGTGLGLPISRHFIEMHKGRVWVESTPGQGSMFSFSIPINNSNEDDSQIDVEDDNLSGEEKVIVAIDDDPNVIKLYERYLDTQGYKIYGIHHGDEALAKVKEYDPDMILLDVLMPDKDGWSLLQELKSDPYTGSIPVIICSIISDKNRAFSLGAADYMIKPITETDLIKALKNLENQENGRVKVLVVDDHADDILLIRRMLEAQTNYSIIEARGGKAGLDLIKNRRPDLVILDLTMPELDGFAIVDELKKHKTTQSIPIIIVSAKELTTSEEQFLTGQVEAMLHKGLFTESELLEDVKQALIHLKPEESVQL